MTGLISRAATDELRPPGKKWWLATQPEALDELLVAFLGLPPEVVEQLAALGNEAQEATAAGEVLLVASHVLGEVLDALGQQGDLEIGAAGVSLVELEIGRVDVPGGDALGGCFYDGVNGIVGGFSGNVSCGVGVGLSIGAHWFWLVFNPAPCRNALVREAGLKQNPGGLQGKCGESPRAILWEDLEYLVR